MSQAIASNTIPAIFRNCMHLLSEHVKHKEYESHAEKKYIQTGTKVISSLELDNR
jgi:hypothetical protein